MDGGMDEGLWLVDPPGQSQPSPAPGVTQPCPQSSAAPTAAHGPHAKAAGAQGLEPVCTHSP